MRQEDWVSQPSFGIVIVMTGSPSSHGLHSGHGYRPEDKERIEAGRIEDVIFVPSLAIEDGEW